jgi:hypothetical protein
MFVAVIKTTMYSVNKLVSSILGSIIFRVWGTCTKL